MCKSVPQIEAVRTRTNTSPGPIDGTGAFSKESPRAACILRKAFIVDGMEKRLLVGQSMLAHANSRGAARLQRLLTALRRNQRISPAPPVGANLYDSSFTNSANAQATSCTNDGRLIGPCVTWNTAFVAGPPPTMSM